MSVNLTDRFPIPGSLGAPVNQGIAVTLATTTTIIQASIVITIDGDVAYTASAFTTGFTGTAVSNGSGGWVFNIVLALDLPFNETTTVLVSCTETPSMTVFSQSYTFQTIRDILISVGAEYSEEGDVLDVGIYCYEGEDLVPNLLQKCTVLVQKKSNYSSATPTNLHTLTFENLNADSDAEDGFFVRFLHPDGVTNQMQIVVTADIDPYAAPNVGTLGSTVDCTYTVKNNNNGIGSSQPSSGGEINLPRLDNSGLATTSFNLKQASYEKVELGNLIPNVTLVDLDFQQPIKYINRLTGKLSYQGGGHRLLPHQSTTAAYVYQKENVLFPTIKGKTILEPMCTNLFPDSSLSVNPFTITTTDNTIINEMDVLEFVPDFSKQIRFTLEGTTIFDSTYRHAIIRSPRVAISSASPVAVSFLARTEFRDSSVTLDHMKIRINFYTSLNVLISSVETDFDPFDFESGKELFLVEAFVALASVPLAATKVDFDIDIDSFEGCDRIKLFVVAPTIEQTTFTTSRVVGASAPTIRLADSLSFLQNNNLNIQEGRVVMAIAPNYDSGIPPQEAFLFDTRSPIAHFDGFYAVHKMSGAIQFTCTTSTGVETSVVVASPLAWQAGEKVNWVFAWKENQLQVTQNSTVVGTFSGSYVQPLNQNTDFHIGENADKTNQLLGEVLTFKVFSTAD